MSSFLGRVVLASICVFFAVGTYTAFRYNTFGYDTRGAGEQLGQTTLQALNGAEYGDILQMRDKGACVVLDRPWPVRGSTESKPEAYQILISCVLDDGGFPYGVKKLAPWVVRVIKPTHMYYNTLAGTYLRQREAPEPEPSPAPTYKGPTPSGPMPTSAAQ